MKLTLGALRHPYTVIVAALMLVAIGVFALPRMATDLLPQFRTPAVQVLTLYPGMPAPVVAADITSRQRRSSWAPLRGVPASMAVSGCSTFDS